MRIRWTYEGAGVGAVETVESNRGLGRRRACRRSVSSDGGRNWGSRSCDSCRAGGYTTGKHVGRDPERRMSVVHSG